MQFCCVICVLIAKIDITLLLVCGSVLRTLDFYECTKRVIIHVGWVETDQGAYFCSCFCRFGIGFGENEDTNGFIGDSAFALKDIDTKFGSWPMVFIQWVFCATATTIPHGAVAERVHFGAVLGLWSQWIIFSFPTFLISVCSEIYHFCPFSLLVVTKRPSDNFVCVVTLM